MVVRASKWRLTEDAEATMPGSGGCSVEVSEGEERHSHGFGRGQHSTVVTGKLDGLPLLPQKMKGCQVQGIEGANW